MKQLCKNKLNVEDAPVAPLNHRLEVLHNYNVNKYLPYYTINICTWTRNKNYI